VFYREAVGQAVQCSELILLRAQERMVGSCLNRCVPRACVNHLRVKQLEGEPQGPPLPFLL
jgi:hypothetical protein